MYDKIHYKLKKKKRKHKIKKKKKESEASILSNLYGYQALTTEQAHHGVTWSLQ